MNDFSEQTLNSPEHCSFSSARLHELTDKVIGGYLPSRNDALALAAYPDLDELCDCAGRIVTALCGSRVDSCSIVNARSGLCGEDCKWCSQAGVHHSNCRQINCIRRMFENFNTIIEFDF